MLGIIGAMEEEVVKIREEMEDTVIEKAAGLEFNIGKIKGNDVVVVRSGIGKVNAAICTQMLIDRYKVKAIVNTGIAGSLRNEINIGDVVISSDALQHDVNAIDFGYLLGEIPGMGCLSFKADDKLIKLAQECCSEVNPGIGSHIGRVLTGDQFISDNEKKEWLVESFHGMCTEMEGAAIAQAAYKNGVPFLIIREISDKADGSAVVEYSKFEKEAIEHSVNLMIAIAERFC